MILCFIVLFLFISPVLNGQAASLYKDVKTDFWAYPSIKWATERGIMRGYTDGTFGPTKPITESQLVSVLSKLDATYVAKAPFVAIKGEDASEGYYRYFKSKNMPLKGYTKISLRHQAVTRGQFAKIIAAADGFNLTEQAAVQYLYAQNLSTGTNGKKTYEDFKPTRVLTRTDATVFLNRLATRSLFKIKGISSTNNGGELPTDIPDNGTIVFPNPTKPDPVSPTSPHDSRLADMDVEKISLIANGIDSSFITLVLKDCYGNPIAYEDSIQFTVASKSGAYISDDAGNKRYNATSIYTDGPDITAEITAPSSTKTIYDTISFQVSSSNTNGINMACYTKPVTVAVKYEPQAELRLEFENTGSDYYYEGETNPIGLPSQKGDQYVKATIVSPGGQVLTNYNGKVRFNSTQLSFANREVSFVNGVARTVVTSYPWGETDFSAVITQADPIYSSQTASITNKIHYGSMNVDRPLTMDYSCPRNFELAFIIDSSGSMKKSDPNRLRVSKSKELMQKLQVNKNVAAKFNTSGTLLGTGQAYPVSYTLDNVTQSGGTNITSGLEKAFSEFTATSTLKVAILVTDGKSSASKLNTLMQIAKTKNIRVYTIGLGDKGQLNEALLQQIASTTGGSYYHVQEDQDIGTAYQSIIDKISCVQTAPGCSYLNQGFINPSIKATNINLYMNTFVAESCGDIARVIVRFNSLEGDIDYELIYRGQNYYAIEKGIYEIVDFSLFSEGTFISYDIYGTPIGSMIVNIQ